MVHNSQSSLHTEPGCTAVNAVQTSTFVNSTDCSFKTNSNEGCVVEDPDPNSYGAAFAAAGGGVFVTEFAETGISCVFFCFMVIRKSLTTRTPLLVYRCQCLVLFSAFILRPFHLSPLTTLLTFIAQQRTQLVARQRKQRRYLNARQTSLKLPIRSLQH